MAVRPVRRLVVPVFGRRFRWRHRFSRAVAVVMAATVSVGLLPAVPALAAPSSPPGVPSPKSVPVSPVKASGSAVADMPASKPPVVTWPAGGSGVVAVDAASTGAARASVAGSAGAASAPRATASAAGSGVPGGLPVRVRAAVDDGVAVDTARSTGEMRRALAASTPPGSVRFDVASKDAAERAGLQGVIFGVSRADGGTAATKVSLDVDYSGFAGAYGGDFGARLRLMSLPACVLVTPEDKACRQATPVTGAANVETARVVSVNGLRVESDKSAAGKTSRQGSAAQGSAASAASSGATVYALASTSSSSAGDYGQTSLLPAYSWTAGGASGDFTYSYPMRTPPSLGGPSPDLTLGYSSGSVDGRTLATNSQASWVGEGWDLQPGFIERQYRTCAQDGSAPYSDLCWYSNNATMMFGGRSVRVVIDPSGNWKAQDDQGLKIEKLSGANNGSTFGEYWKITALDGTQYFFGRGKGGRYTGDTADTASAQVVPVYGNNPGEPCYNSSSMYNSRCWLPYRWNLDYVVDPRGNSMTYFYGNYVGSYGGMNGTHGGATYTITAWPDHVDYGTRAGSEGTSTAPMRVNFGISVRCYDGTVCANHPENWPDTPWDQFCATNATACGHYSPSFWTPYKLSSVQTQVWNAAASAYRNVDTYNLTYVYPATGDYIAPAGDDTSPSLWLNRISHTGTASDGSSATLPDVHFDGVRMANRVDWGSDVGVPPLMHYRIAGVDNGTGGYNAVGYVPAECTRNSPPNPDHNAARCFPQYFQPQGAPAGWGWFHKYIVDHVTNQDRTGGSPDETWTYVYGALAVSDQQLWHHDDNDVVPAAQRSWSQWRGYPTVYTYHGTPGGQQTVSQDLYYRGMDGDTTDTGWRPVNLTDSQGTVVDQQSLQGVLREHTEYLNGTSVVASSTIHEPWTTGRGSYPNIVWMHRDAKARTRTWIAATNTWRWTEQQYSYDSYGLPTDVKDLGDTATGNDDTCTHTDYARNTGDYLINFPAQVLTTTCAASPGDSDYLAGTQNFYDWTTTVGASHNKGFLTKTTALAGVSSGAMTWKQTGRTDYDSYGRPTASYDALERKTQFGYTPATGGPVTASTVTNALGWTTTTQLDPGMGNPTSVVDINGKTTTAQYDPLGRLIKVWRNNRPSSATPDIQYAYTVSLSTPNSVRTQKLGPAGQQISSYTIYDGLMRPRQTQTPAPQAIGGRVVTGTIYDGRGQPVKSSTFWNNASGPTSSLVAADDADVVNQHRFAYDNLQRQTVDALYSNNVLKWQTTTSYDGDRSTVTPPEGGIPTSTVSDARGNTTTLRQQAGGGQYQDTTYTYDRLGRQISVTDPAGNMWTTTYDLRGRVTQTTDPDKGTTTSTYDDAGQLLTTKDALNTTLAYAYDALGRKTAMWKDAVNTGTKLADWTYDTLTSGTVVKGQPATSTRYNGTDAYSSIVTGYDDAYRPLGTTVRIPAVEAGLAGDWTTSTTYNVDGSPATVTYPAAAGLGAETVTTSYDNVGLPVTLAGLDTYIADTQYYYWGTVKQQLLGSAPKQVKLTTGADEATGRLTQLSTSTQADATTFAEKLTQNYTYNPAGQVTSIAETNAGNLVSNECFGYDGLQQLTEAWTTTATTCQTSPTQPAVGGPDAYWTSYRYDKVGNRTSDISHDPAGDTTRTYTYPAAGAARPHAVTSVATTGATVGTSTYSYDNAGNTTSRNIASKPGQELKWDAEGHLATVKDNVGTASYLYDASGDRLIAHDSAGATLYLGATEVHRNTVGAISATRFYGSTAVRTDPGGLTWLASDHHATGELAINAGDLTITRRKSDPFGNPRGAQSTWPTTHGYVNGVTDPTGLTHLGAREYDPAIGRFISGDPILDVADPQQMNGYSYAGNNPTTASDPTGLRFDNDVPGSAPGNGGHTSCGDNCAPPKYGSQHGWEATPQKKQPSAPTLTRDQQAAYDNAQKIKKQTVVDVLVSQGLKFLLDLVGVSDIVDCFSKGDLWACGSAALSVMPVGKALTVGKDIFKALTRGFKAYESWQRAMKLADEVIARTEELLRRGGASCALHSFDPATPVLMADGTHKAIKDVKVGDRVVTTDPDSGQTTIRTVTRLHLNIDTDLTDVTVVDVGGRAQTLHTTQHHPFWDATSHSWADASGLQVGHQLRSVDGSIVAISAVRNFRGQHEMRDLTVADIHTYYVIAGNTPVLVHNCGNAATHSVDNLADSLGDDVFFHYTDEAGHAAIMEGGVVKANSKGVSYFTQDMVKSGDANNVLFAGNPQYAGRGSHVIGFRISPDRLGPGVQPNELVHEGSFRFTPDDVIYHGPNPFG